MLLNVKVGHYYLKEFWFKMPSQWRVTAYLSEEMYKAFEAWAASENRSLSNLAGTIITNALEKRDEQKKAK